MKINIDYQIFSSETIDSFVEKIQILKEELKDKHVLLTLPELHQRISKDEKSLANAIMQIQPKKFGVTGAFLGFEWPSNNLVAIRDQKYVWHRKWQEIPTQYTTKKFLQNFEEMNKALKKDLGKKLLLISGYRSPAYQICTFVFFLKLNKYSFDKTIARVAIPGYSEHGSIKFPAADFITENGLPSDNHPLNFARTKEYRWLKRNAGRFGFFESFPKNNQTGIMFEPWHWQLETNSA